MEPVTMQRIQQDIERFGIADAAIAELKARYSVLQIAGVDDLQGFEAVKRARLEVRKFRTKVEDVRKELKADSLEYGRRVDAEAKRITALILEVEGDLQAKEQAIEQQRQEIAQAAQRALEERRRVRVAAAAAAGLSFDGQGYSSPYCATRLQQQELDSLEDGNFEALLQVAAQAKQEAEAAALAAEQARQAAEAAERARLQAEQEALREQQRALAAEQAKFAEERAELERLRAQAAKTAPAAPHQPAQAQAQAFPWEAPAAAPATAEAPAEAFPWDAPIVPLQGCVRLISECPDCGLRIESESFNLQSRQGEACCYKCGQLYPVVF